ncbi:5917_t:CDS:2 [Funneliformis mosseae]|uniref:5917_t:CDS:1 n=1 Tax=Funneliformis mosseae TaxID=27381 RepID=A0A9N8WNF9_FUNMO|nr:5917_t:CDS:2 [Funneliformis mosseae]
MQHLSEVLFLIKNAILAVKVTNSTLADFDYRFEDFNNSI